MVFDFDGRQLSLDALFLEVSTPLFILLSIGHVEKCPFRNAGVTPWSQRVKKCRITAAFVLAYESNLLSFGVQSIHTLGRLQSLAEVVVGGINCIGRELRTDT